jgi:hypothetical protein
VRILKTTEKKENNWINMSTVHWDLIIGKTTCCSSSLFINFELSWFTKFLFINDINLKSSILNLWDLIKRNIENIAKIKPNGDIIQANLYDAVIPNDKDKIKINE